MTFFQDVAFVISNPAIDHFDGKRGLPRNDGPGLGHHP